ncbi:hypothetical protein GINT2_000864 [Glugoides intestinalis]
MIVRGEIQSVSDKKISVDCAGTILEIFLEVSNVTLDNIREKDRVIAALEHLSMLPKSTVTISCTQNDLIYKDHFRYISDIKKDVYSDIIAVCTEFKPLIKTKGTDSLFSLNLLDHSGCIELKVFIKAEHFPKFISENENKDPFKPGNILLIRNVKRILDGKIAVIQKPCIIQELHARNCSSPTETLVFKFLTNLYKTSSYSTTFYSQKFKRIEELSDMSFFNIIGKVIHCNAECVPSVCITDFTNNQKIQRIENSFPNDMALLIKLFGQHADLYDRVTPGRYYLFKNIRMHVFGVFLEAYMHDSLEGDIVPIDDENLLGDLLNREEAFHRENIAGSSALNDIVKKEPKDEEYKDKQNKNKALQGDKSPCTGNGEERHIKEGLDESHKIPIIPIHKMTVSGIYLCLCLIIDMIHFLDTREIHSILSVIESGKEYKIKTKSNLSKKIVEEKKISIGYELKCLVMKTRLGNLFMVDIFADESEYKNFLDFYFKAD